LYSIFGSGSVFSSACFRSLASECLTVGKRFSFPQKSVGGLKLSAPSLSSFCSRSARTIGHPPSRSDCRYPSKDGTASVLKPDGQATGIDHDLQTCGQTDDVVCVGQGVRLIEIVDTSTESPLSIPPGSKLLTCRSPTARTFGASHNSAQIDGQS